MMLHHLEANGKGAQIYRYHRNFDLILKYPICDLTYRRHAGSEVLPADSG